MLTGVKDEAKGSRGYTIGDQQMLAYAYVCAVAGHMREHTYTHVRTHASADT